MAKLYGFSNHYFETHGVESAPKKDKDVQEQMQQTVALLDKLQSTTSSWSRKPDRLPSCIPQQYK